MRTLPPEPNPGEKISATLIREIIRAIRERTPLQSPGVKVSIGPNGYTLNVDPGKSTASGARADNSCFRLVKRKKQRLIPNTIDEVETVEYISMECLVYNIGGVTKGNPGGVVDISNILEDYIEEHDLDEEEEEEETDDDSEDPFEPDPKDTDIYICLKLTNTSPSIVAMGQHEFAIEQLNYRNYVRPLYLFKLTEMIADLRNAPQLQYIESIML